MGISNAALQLGVMAGARRESVQSVVAKDVWKNKYQYMEDGVAIDLCINDTLRRVTASIASVELAHNKAWFGSSLYRAMSSLALLPAGRILAGCGTGRDVTLSNTFVMQKIPDSVDGIMETARQAAVTMKSGGGIGVDFSTVRPRGTRVKGLDCAASGPIAAMEVFDSSSGLLSTGNRRGAMMATLMCDHPDIVSFVTAKSVPGRLNNFNLSVLATDAFMEAVRAGSTWNLVWGGDVREQIPARELWDLIMRQNYDMAEPGILFIDRINKANPLNYMEELRAPNSCAEQFLPENGTCPLASINLARLVRDPFTPRASIDVKQLRNLVSIAVRMLDNVLDISYFPLPKQYEEAQAKRRIGIGVMGVADALAMLNIRYGEADAVDTLGSWMRTIQNASYRASSQLARERGSFPVYDAERHLDQPSIRMLDPDVRDMIKRYGLRNGTLTSIAPTGSTSMLAENVSSGIEPIFANAYKRMFLQPDGQRIEKEVVDYAVLLYRKLCGTTPLSESFVTVAHLDPQDHIKMQASAQRWVDSGISKTVNCPESIPFDRFSEVYHMAYVEGCKGCTTYRPNNRIGSVLAA